MCILSLYIVEDPSYDISEIVRLQALLLPQLQPLADHPLLAKSVQMLFVRIID